jgi:hypothetical protein
MQPPKLSPPFQNDFLGRADVEGCTLPQAAQQRPAAPSRSPSEIASSEKFMEPARFVSRKYPLADLVRPGSHTIEPHSD